MGLEANFKNRPEQNLYPPAICKMTCGIMVLHLIRSCTMRVLFAIKFRKIFSWNMCRRLHEAGHHFLLCKHVQCKAVSSWCKQHINILLPRKRSPCCPFFVVVASTFNTQRLPGLFHCGKRYRSARLYLYKSDAPVPNLHLLRSWKQVGSKFIFNICMG